MGNRLNLPEGTETILIVDDQETVWTKHNRYGGK